MKYLVLLIILIVAGYYGYQYFFAPTPENLQKALIRKWFDPQAPAYPEFKNMIDRFEVASDFSVTVHLSEAYRLVSDSPTRLFQAVTKVVSKESPRPSAPVKFVFQEKDVGAQ